MNREIKEYSPESVPNPDPIEEVFGSTEPKIIGKRQVRDIRKRCFLTSGGGSLSVYDTNDAGMKAGNGKIRITRAGYYVFHYSFDMGMPGDAAVTQGYVQVNGSTVATVSYQDYVLPNSGRTVLGGSKIVKVKNGDLVSFAY